MIDVNKLAELAQKSKVFAEGIAVIQNEKNEIRFECSKIKYYGDKFADVPGTTVNDELIKEVRDFISERLQDRLQAVAKEISDIVSLGMPSYPPIKKEILTGIDYLMDDKLLKP